VTLIGRRKMAVNRMMNKWGGSLGDAARCVIAAAIATSVLATSVSLSGAPTGPRRTFATPEEAVRALADAVKAGNLDEVVAIFAPDGQELAASSDLATGRKNREVFTAAFAQGWRLVNQGANRKTLVIGDEAWPFPVPLVKEGSRWRFDTSAGKEEVLARRIGRNELDVIAVCRAYVSAQQRYARDGHDGKRPGLFAMTLHSELGKQNGLYWVAAHGQKRSPLGDLVAQAAEEGRPIAEGGGTPMPLYGYYFKILTAQGPHAAGGAKSYVVDGEMSGGFALLARPALYDASGVMTFVVNQDGIVRQKDLGPRTEAVASAMTDYDPDASWSAVH
jgi:hypothetical protein